MNQTKAMAMDFRQYSRSIIIPAADSDLWSWKCIFADVNGFAEFYDQAQNLFQDENDTYISCDEGVYLAGIVDGWNTGETPDQVAKNLSEGYFEALYEDYVASFYSY